MKLRNKETGEIKEWDSIGFRKGRSNGWDDFTPNADSLAALNEVWEDYKPAEPLIKDEKIRKAVRAWYDSLRAIMCDGGITFYDDEAFRTFQIDVWNKYSNTSNTRAIAEIDLLFDCYNLEDGKIYTIAELCGEEEE